MTSSVIQETGLSGPGGIQWPVRVLGRWGVEVFWREAVVRSELRRLGLGVVCRKHEERK